ncbi:MULTISPECIES: hypothetical protein [unclassified Methylophaga]|jgi:hypothetical protein|uniref:hypothetical protein n=1 Tax=unclassified Methylophaga TaxID=2629249 RepID=UPI00259CEBF5|nr:MULTISPECIES: hypothetical protein [unclassified Methylophaga]|tara:strand:+ start:36375 stop:36752 length:378 start_codon:yes stop_codon:yes gene_type:complete
MNNGDMPAMPFEGGQNSGMQPHTGLTKREELAARNMAALLSAWPGAESLGYSGVSDSQLAKQAIDTAYTLLSELEKPKQLTELEKELIESLERCLSEMQGGDYCEVGDSSVEQAEKAIAKARGKQ